MRLASFAQSVRPGGELPGAVPLLSPIEPSQRGMDVFYGDELAEIQVPAGVALSFPLDMCCNCGATHERLHLVAIDAPYATLWRRGHLYLALPHCPSCVPTASRRRWSPAERIAMGFVGFIAAVALIVPLSVALDVSVLFVWVSIALAMVAFVGLSGARRATSGGQTTAYAAVSVRRAEHPLFGQLRSVTLGFSNHVYARLVATHLRSIAFALRSPNERR